MNSHSDSALGQMAHLGGEMTELAVAGQAAGLRLLAAEMQALASLMPGLAAPSALPSALPSDPEVEAEFDNMPV